MYSLPQIPVIIIDRMLRLLLEDIRSNLLHPIAAHSTVTNYLAPISHGTSHLGILCHLCAQFYTFPHLDRQPWRTASSIL
jgi:hypothetical protein